MDISKADQFKGCIIAGAIGDAMGSGYENLEEEKDDVFYLFGKPEKIEPQWCITDDTQLTLATIEAMVGTEAIDSENIAQHFLSLFKQKKIRGIGSSTLKALQELNAGGHWSQVGRRGEYAAGNGAAMRIAPLAFREGLSNSDIRNICSITHQNDEAYIGARCVVIAIKAAIGGEWTGQENLLELIIDKIPDTRVRDRLIEIKDIQNLKEVGELGNNGYVVNSVPLAIASASKVKTIGLKQMFRTLIDIGGDTDTNCSIAGQIAGALIGVKEIPDDFTKKLATLQEYEWIISTVNGFVINQNWNN